MTYTNREELRHRLFAPLWQISWCYRQMEKPEKALETLEEAFDSYPKEMEYCMDYDGYGPTIFVIAARICFELNRIDRGLELLRKAKEFCLIAKGIADLPLIENMFELPANLQLHEKV